LPRLADDRETVRMFVESGFSGCVLKGHCEPTAGRAVAAGAGSGITVLGGIVLNHAVGGINPAAVSATLALGGRVVWMPTLDARAHRERGLPLPNGWPVAAGIAVPPVDERHAGAVDDILRLVAEADAVLATGHLGPAECGWLVRRARDAGVKRILLTHPTFAVPRLDSADIEELCVLGAIAEITAYQMLRGDDPAQLAALAGRLGAKRCVLSSDAGQPDSPPPPEALALLVDRLVAAGLDAGAARAMASETAEQLVR
jgi:Family of unknown function (DUF6282)